MNMGGLNKVDMLKDTQKQTSMPKKSSSVVPLRPTIREKTSLVRGKSNVSVLKKTDMAVNRILNCRHELKYLVSESKAQAAMRVVESYLPLDRFCKLQPGGMCPIVSLYLDSHNLQLCRESLEGHKNRFKLRIRSYTNDVDYPRFFEIKRRVNTIITKDRARVKHHNIVSLLSGLSLPPQDRDTEYQTIQHFQLYMNSINAAPVIKIRYMRRAYEGDLNNRVRITFDRQLAFNVCSAPDVSFSGPGWQRYPLNGVVLEIKFTGSYPAWLNQMVKHLGLYQQSFSKYALSMKNACSLGFCSPQIPARIH